MFLDTPWDPSVVDPPTWLRIDSIRMTMALLGLGGMKRRVFQN
ncbi:MAG TPA: hypothetical protein VHO46_14630 [Bacteroidales bacterium]|nr:hypothetical protein [Bacteroidales bacterium]